MADILATIQALFYVFDLLFDFWPVLVLSALKSRGNLLRNMLIAWSFWAVARVFLFFNPEPIAASLLIPEPLNTVLFFVAGIILAGIQCGIKLWQRNKFQRKTGEVESIEDLLDLTPTEFEEMVVEVHRAFGHRARRTGGPGDHGVDVVVQTKQGEQCVVQCKRWRGSVGEPVVRDFYGVMHHEKADRGIIITTGRFTRPAREWARGKPILMYDGNEFVKLWKRAQAKKGKAKTARGVTAAQ